MLPVLYDIRKLLHVEEVATDNGVFRLHYKGSVILFVAFSLLLGARQYFGDPITCQVDGGVPAKVMDTYCWISGTWTIRELNADVMKKEVPHPGIGIYDESKHEKIYHMYYQWVPLVMVLTAVFFYLPRFLWKILEGGMMAYACKDMKFPNLEDDEKHALTVDRQRARRLMHFYLGRHSIENDKYAYRFFFCELLNFVNVVGQLIATNVFLNGAFAVYGHELLHYFELNELSRVLKNVEGVENHMNPADVVFPKVGSCTFLRFGPTGNLQTTNGICVLPLNILNEKIYYIIWFWYIFLITVTSFGMIYRVLAIAVPAVRRWVLFPRFGMIDYRDIILICTKCSIGDWFVLRQISKNVDPNTFAVFVQMLRNHYEVFAKDQKELLNRGRSKSRMENLENPPFSKDDVEMQAGKETGNGDGKGKML